MVNFLGAGHRYYIYHSAEFRPLTRSPRSYRVKTATVTFRSFARLHHLFPVGVTTYCQRTNAGLVTQRPRQHNAKEFKKKKSCDSCSSHALRFVSTARSFNYESLPSGKACVNTACRPDAYVLASNLKVPFARLTYPCPARWNPKHRRSSYQTIRAHLLHFKFQARQ